MFAFLARRTLEFLVVIFGVLTIVFVLQRFSGDPTNLLLPVDAPQEVRTELRHQLGLDRPLPEQYLRFIGRVAVGDLGDSYRFRQPALGLVLERLPATLLLASASLLISLVLALPLGTLAAVYRNTWIDSLATGISLLGQAMPVYWLGLLGILLFSVQWRLLPSMGGGSFAALVLPATTLAVYSAARIMRLTRAAVLDVLHQDFIRLARAKGLGEGKVLVKHALRNASIPIVTIIGLQFGGLLGGAVITETVFAWPGVGRLAVNAVQQRDFPVVQAVTVVIALAFSLINLAVDVLYARLNPRIRLG
ncbi:ABC transporter permease [Alsobacter sp. SYSU M60028]|uniref:ABC transporter permease n=1 Tax=Alsobacter ponti TaxID=2962936 RepID=A0ABT1L9S3_9HYPH|nr:ABC transporter permease [Alsobacter ponti]MCP8938247.1 ABC transporter permease [Alsobacter ponti]